MFFYLDIYIYKIRVFVLICIMSDLYKYFVVVDIFDFDLKKL